MVIDPPILDWRARLARLEDPSVPDDELSFDGPWLRSIRARIFRYLIARYGSGPIAPESDAASARPTSVPFPSDPPAAAAAPGVRPFAFVDHPPRDAESFVGTLDELKRLARQRRRSRGADGPAEEAWSWWRERCFGGESGTREG